MPLHAVSVENSVGRERTASELRPGAFAGTWSHRRFKQQREKRDEKQQGETYIRDEQHVEEEGWKQGRKHYI